jgi:hypothetical protein
MKILREDLTKEIFATINSRIVCLPESYPNIDTKI